MVVAVEETDSTIKLVGWKMVSLLIFCYCSHVEPRVFPTSLSVFLALLAFQHFFSHPFTFLFHYAELLLVGPFALLEWKGGGWEMLVMLCSSIKVSSLLLNSALSNS